MSVVIPIGYTQGIYRWSLEGDPEEMTVTLGFSTVAFVGTNEQLAEELYDQAVASGSITHPTEAMIEGWTFVGVTIYKMTSTGLVTAEHVEPVTSTAGFTVTPPNNCALIIQKRTALAGQRHRGRMYLPPFAVDEAQVSNTGMIADASYNAIAARVAGWFSNMEPNGTVPVLLHSDGGTPTAVTSLNLQRQIGTQRRRMRN